MSRLLQALKNLENRQSEAKASAPPAAEPKPGELELVSTGRGASRGGSGLLAHLADRPHTPSPDPAPAPRSPARPTPIEPPEASSPLAKLSAGVPAAWLAGPTLELLAGPTNELLAGPPEELLTAFESLPTMTHEAAALARPAEASPSPAAAAPPAQQRIAAEPAEPAARWPEPRRPSPLDKLSARWPVSEPLPTPRPSTQAAAASEPAAESRPQIPAEPPLPVAAAPPVPPEPAVETVIAPAIESAPLVGQTFATESLASEPVVEEPIAYEAAARVEPEPSQSQQSRHEFPSHTPALPQLASCPTASVAPAAVSTTAPQTLIERTTRRTLADPQRSEPYRQVAERIVRDLAHVAGRSAVLTGVGPASDTSELVLVTAAALENVGGQVLVIDGDTAHRSLTTQLELSDAAGLAELLKLREVPAKYIRPLSLGNVSFLPIGKARFPDPEPVASQLAALVQSLEAEYSLVLIDGGRTTELAAATLARLADATYFVIRLGHTEASVAQNALRDFRAAGARVLGCVATS